MLSFGHLIELEQDNDKADLGQTQRLLGMELLIQKQ